MGRAQAVPVGDEDAAQARLVDGRGRVALEHPLQQPDGRARGHRRDDERLACRLAQRHQVIPDERPRLG